MTGPQVHVLALTHRVRLAVFPDIRGLGFLSRQLIEQE
jgi:hypothetical protein